MIRAADEPAPRRLAYLGEHVPAVTTHIVKGRRLPSSSRVSNADSRPSATAHRSPAPRKSSERPTHTQLSSKKCSISQSSTETSVKASAGRLICPSGTNDEASNSRSMGVITLPFRPVLHALLDSPTTGRRATGTPVAPAHQLQYNLL